jgi:phosphoribosylglycinamide formyltransferase-1
MAARLVILISGRGRNLAALLDAVADGCIDAEVAGVISNRADAAGLAIARKAGVPVRVVPHADFADRAAFDAALATTLRDLRPDIIALAGFMRVLGTSFVQEFQGRMLNIHPSLLPKHRGLQTHRAVLDAGDAVHGATVHFVTAMLDGGPSVIQGQFSVLPQDDADSLARRTMEEVELKIFPQAVAWMARGELRLMDETAEFRGRRLDAPLKLDDLEEAFE